MGPFLRAALILSLGTQTIQLGQHSPPPSRNTGPARPAESCTTGQDLLIQALERLQANSRVGEVEEANQLIKRALDLCSESGEAWYYRSLVEARLKHAPQAAYALRQATLFPSDALRDQLNPFVLATPDAGKGHTTPPIHERWALVIGISKFADHRIPGLDYTTADANYFHDALIDPRLGGFKAGNVKVLTDSGASLVEIRKGLNWLARSAASDDLAVVYVASHGSPRSDDTAGANYIIAHDTEMDPQHVDPDALYASALPMVDLANMVATRLKSLRTAVFLDTCYSGGAVSKTSNSALAKAAVSTATLNHISQGAGRIIFAASRNDQESLESGDLHHGYFTWFLVEALRAHPDMPLSRIFTAVERQVSARVDKDYELYGMHQTPVMSQSSNDADFALGVGGANLSAAVTR